MPAQDRSEGSHDEAPWTELINRDASDSTLLPEGSSAAPGLQRPCASAWRHREPCRISTDLNGSAAAGPASRASSDTPQGQRSADDSPRNCPAKALPLLEVLQGKRSGAEHALLLPGGVPLSSPASPSGTRYKPGSLQQALLTASSPAPQRLYMVFIFTLTASLLYADQNLLAPNLTAVADEFGFDKLQRDKYLGGIIAAAFFSVGAPSALLIGYLADRVNRCSLLFFVVILGEGPCLATFWVRRYWQLLVLRTLTGISVGGALPLVLSLVGDLFFVTERAHVAAAVQVATGAGFALGQLMAGFVGPWAGWRWPFVIVAAPAVAAAVLMVLTTREPPRGCTERALQAQYAAGGYEYAERVSARKVLAALRIRTNALVAAQGLPGSLPWGVLLTYLNDFLAEDQGLSVRIATSVMMAWGVGGGIGVLAGGAAGQALHNRSRHLMPLFVGACVAAAPAPIWWLINAPLRGRPLGLVYAAAFLGGALASPPGPNARAMLLNVNEPETRGCALALQTVLDDLGKGAGPALVYALIAAWGRVAAFNAATLGWLPCGALFAAAALTLAGDEDALQERLRRKVEATAVARREDELDLGPGPNPGAGGVIQPNGAMPLALQPLDVELADFRGLRHDSFGQPL